MAVPGTAGADVVAGVTGAMDSWGRAVCSPALTVGDAEGDVISGDVLPWPDPGCSAALVSAAGTSRDPTSEAVRTAAASMRRPFEGWAS
ncbi:hypothetical protein [Pseudarthrobacter sp. W1I19]|uniref:hypothetical protein n=1 Tax=Pseudarthrobacter sp. W1I19 TaxID=3042288 RepID=UPI0027D7E0F9|nr:hypothetical protein [Pseudarthrobacter sp. W1I19]